MSGRLKLPRTIRLDPSDTLVFAQAAEPGEWAVSGAFMFGERSPDEMSAKERIAFRSGFLGVASLGWSSLVIVSEAREDEREAAIAALALFLQQKFGAPDEALAKAAARQEIDFAAALCDHPEGMLLGVHRTFEEGGIREQFRSLHKRAGTSGADRLHAHARAFTIVESDDEEPQERADLAGLLAAKRAAP